jgi:TolA-binding protein
MTTRFILSFCFLLLFGKSFAQNTAVNYDHTRFFREAYDLFTQKMYQSSQNRFQQFIHLSQNEAIYPNQANLLIEAHYYNAVCALKLESEDAEVILENFVQTYPTHPKAAEAYFDWGNEYFEQGDYAKAITYLEQATENQIHNEKSLLAKFQLAKAYFQQRKYKDAQKSFDALKTEGDYQYVASFYAGYLSMLENADNQALKDLQKAMQAKEFANETPIYITQIYYRQKQYRELTRFTSPLLNANRNLKQVEEIYLLTADSYFQQNDCKNAVENYKAYLGLLNKSVENDIPFRLGYCQYQLGAYLEAIENLKRTAAEKSSQGQNAAFYLGLAYLKTGNKAFAITAFEQVKATQFNPQLIENADWHLCKLYFEAERYNEAIGTLKDFLKKYPQHPDNEEATDLLGKAYLNSSRYDEALTYMEALPQKSNALKGAYQQIAYSKALESFNMGQYGQAIPFFQKSLSYPLNAELVALAKFWLAETYSLAENPKGAIPLYQEILDVESTMPKYSLQAHYGLGYAHYNLQQYNMAATHFQVYVSRIQNEADRKYYEDALLRLGDCYYASRSYADAARIYEQVINLNYADKDYACYQRAMILQILNQPLEAKKSLQIIVNQFPNSLYYDQALYQQGLIDIETGSYAVATTSFSKLINEKSNSSLIPDALLKRALANKNINNSSAAVNDYKMIIDNYPNHPNASNALFGLQEILLNEGKEADLKAYMEKYSQANPNSQTTEKLYFENAKTAYFNQNYASAVNLFNLYLTNFPKSANSFDAKFYMGESFFRMADLNNSLRYHQEVVQEKRSSFLARSARRSADLNLERKSYPQAISYYKILAGATDSKREQINAYSGLMEGYYQLNRLDSVNYYSEQILSQANVAGAKNLAQLYKAKILYRQGRFENALAALQNLANSALDETGAEAQYLIGEIYFQQKNHKKSLDILFELNKKFSQFEKWRGRGFLLIADNYIALGENFQAKATLQSIIDKSPDQEVVNLARQKLAGVK